MSALVFIAVFCWDGERHTSNFGSLEVQRPSHVSASFLPIASCDLGDLSTSMELLAGCPFCSNCPDLFWSETVILHGSGRFDPGQAAVSLAVSVCRSLTPCTFNGTPVVSFLVTLLANFGTERRLLKMLNSGHCYFVDNSNAVGHR